MYIIDDFSFFNYLHNLSPIYLFLLSFCIAAIITSNFYFMFQHYCRRLNDDEHNNTNCDVAISFQPMEATTVPDLCQIVRPNSTYCCSLEVNANEWENLFPTMDQNCYQSPINIRKQSINILERQYSLRWKRYDEIPDKVILKNNGSTIEMTCDYGCRQLPSITQIDQLFDEYFFKWIKFRWSMSNGDGSEHMIDDVRYPMEIQITHATARKRKEPKYLCVSYFFTIVPHNNIYLDPIVKNLGRLEHRNDKVVLMNEDTFPLAWLLSQFETGYFSYSGSLTEPPYTENIFWIVQPEPLAIGSEQINYFRRMLAKNFFNKFHYSRPVQNLNMRNIFYNIPENCRDNLKLL